MNNNHDRRRRIVSHTARERLPSYDLKIFLLVIKKITFTLHNTASSMSRDVLHMHFTRCNFSLRPLNAWNCGFFSIKQNRFDVKFYQDFRKNRIFVLLQMFIKSCQKFGPCQLDHWWPSVQLSSLFYHVKNIFHKT